MNIEFSKVSKQWPIAGKHILASFNSETISVYQAYNPIIAKNAVLKQKFEDGFSYNRMSWIKPNFLWMMYRCGWASKEGQEKVLEIQIPTDFFDEILSVAVSSTFDPQIYKSKDVWKEKIENSDVRLQWDPDHDPFGKATERKAIQLGLRGKILENYGKQKIVKILDITDFVLEQKINLNLGIENLFVPLESVYLPARKDSQDNIGLNF